MNTAREQLMTSVAEVAAKHLPTGCLGCTATQNCIADAVGAGAGLGNPERALSAATGWVRSYAALVVRCAGPDACIGATINETAPAA